MHSHLSRSCKFSSSLCSSLSPEGSEVYYWRKCLIFSAHTYFTCFLKQSRFTCLINLRDYFNFTSFQILYVLVNLSALDGWRTRNDFWPLSSLSVYNVLIRAACGPTAGKRPQSLNGHSRLYQETFPFSLNWEQVEGGVRSQGFTSEEPTRWWCQPNSVWHL